MGFVAKKLVRKNISGETPALLKNLLYAWGATVQGQVGNNVSNFAPVNLGTSSWTAVSAGPAAHTAAIAQ